MIIIIIIKNQKTFLATPIIMAKYAPNFLKTLKNNINLKSNNKFDAETS